jgi:branched-chain amino acid aminotransferase
VWYTTERLSVPSAGMSSSSSIRVWVDGQPVSGDHLAISAFDRGLTLADGLFELMRVINGVALKLPAHLARLERGADRLGLVLPAELQAQVVDAAATARRIHIADAVLRLTVTRGDALPGTAGLSGGAARTILTLTPRFSLSDDVIDRGLALITSQWRFSATHPTAGIKSLDYTGNVLALREAHQLGADDALMLDTNDRIIGCTASNVCWLSDATLFTPSEQTGALPGTTLAVLRELAPDVGLTVVDAEAPVDALQHADAAFACSSIRGVIPIAQVDGVHIGTHLRPPRFRALHDAWRAEMARLAHVDFVVD